MAGVALGFIETRGNSGSIIAIDAMLKTAHVDLMKKVEIGGGFVTAVVKGEVGAVKSAVEAGAEAAAKISELVSANVIPSVHADVRNLIGIK